LGFDMPVRPNLSTGIDALMGLTHLGLSSVGKGDAMIKALGG